MSKNETTATSKRVHCVKAELTGLTNKAGLLEPAKIIDRVFGFGFAHELGRNNWAPHNEHCVDLSKLYPQLVNATDEDTIGAVLSRHFNFKIYEKYHAEDPEAGFHAGSKWLVSDSGNTMLKNIYKFSEQPSFIADTAVDFAVGLLHRGIGYCSPHV
eukprot:TRINITY_DN4572_c0_g1_i1.p1 TRINITY_DN4572_c0_g1~~TRINITY_DN4572_c0_g1_i1.p1  ORF type:complete len:157 (-),score=24.00 TRINITY_DN4572_c0_g1_i1:99-569(-)